MDEYSCIGCSYKYDPHKGDETRSIPPGTSFDSLPDDWSCPDCGAGKLGFVKRLGADSRRGKKNKMEDDLRHINAENVGWKSSINR